MVFKEHSELRGKHALFSPSQSAWLRYPEEKVTDRIQNRYRTALGTEIHEYAAEQIELAHKLSSVKYAAQGIEDYIFTKYRFLSNNREPSRYAEELIRHLGLIPKEVFETVRYYINDAIGFRMTPEQPLVYSGNVFGTADAINFKNNKLRIHDLKTGAQPAHMEQLEIYAALFCLEYDTKPSDIEIELRLYQWDGIVVHNPEVDDLVPIIDRIITIEKLASREE